MEIRIGVTYSPKELQIDVGDDTDREQLAKDVEQAVSSDNGVLWITDRRGRRVAVPGAKVAYVEIGTPEEARRVGFAR